MPLKPLRPLARHDVPYLRREYVLLHLRSLSRIRRKRRVQRVEDRRVIVQGLEKPPQKVGSVVAGLLLHQGHYVRCLVAYHGEKVPEVIPRDAVEAVDCVNREGLPDTAVQHVGFEILELFSDGVEFEGDAQGVGELGKAAAGFADGVERGANSGNAEEGRGGGAGGEGLHEGGPLVALEDVEVDDVDTIFGFEGFEDGLVGGEVSELDVGAGLVHDLVDFEDFHGV